MILEVGKAERMKFIPLIKKTNIFECGANGIVIEKEKGNVTLYVTNNSCSKIYARVDLGGKEILKENKFQIAARSEELFLIHGQEIKIVVDYAEKKVAVNKPEIKVTGKADWGDEARMPWNRSLNKLFGLAVDPMDWDDGREFWKWFLYNEVEILNKTAAGGEDAAQVTRKVRRKLAPVLRLDNPEELELELRYSDGQYALVVHYKDDSQLKQDAQLLGTFKPDTLDAWTCSVEE